MENLVKEGFDPQLGLFLATEDNRLYPNPNARVAMDSALAALEFLGKIMGLIIYEVGGTPVLRLICQTEASLCSFFQIPLQRCRNHVVRSCKSDVD